MHRIWLTLASLLLLAMPSLAQDDALNLPSELYVLMNSGSVDRYGLDQDGLSTVTPPDQFVLDFGIAPDGNWLAYRTENFLAIANMRVNEGSIIENETAGVPALRGHGDTLVWSPNADMLAYTTLSGARIFFNNTAQPTFADIQGGPFQHLSWSPSGQYLAAEADGDVWWVYRIENASAILTSAIPSSSGTTWYSPSDVVFAPAEGGLALMNLANANAQTVLLDNTWEYHLPQRLANGILLVFGRQKDDTNTEPGTGRLLGLRPDSPQIENLSQLPLDLTGMRWAPTGNLLAAFQGGALVLINPLTTQGFTLPIANAISYSWGPLPLERVTGLEMPVDAFFLAQDANGIAQVWRLPSDGSPAAPITSAKAHVTGYAVAPDEGSIAYSSGQQLWLQRLDGSTSIVLAPLGGDADAQPAFSRDGTRIAYADNGIWLVSAAGGDARQLIADVTGDPQTTRVYRKPQFASNLEALLVQIGFYEGATTGLLDPTSGVAFEMAVRHYDATWLGDGRILTYGQVTEAAQTGGLTVADVNTLNQPAILLPDLISVATVEEVTPGQLRMLLPTNSKGPAALRAVDMFLSDGQLAPVAHAGFVVLPSLSPRGQLVGGYAYLDSNPGSARRGPLTIRSLETGRQVILREPANVWAFHWGPPR